jgi:hypothetical protein
MASYDVLEGTDPWHFIRKLGSKNNGEWSGRDHLEDPLLGEEAQRLSTELLD